MKKAAQRYGFLLFCGFLLATAPACKAKYGCPINEEAHNQPDKKGNYKKSKTRSGVFPPGVYKKRKKG